MTYEQAKEKALAVRNKNFPSCVYGTCGELEDRWVFLFTPTKNGENTAFLSFFIFKKDGRLQHFSIPPIENLEIINRAKKIDF